MSFDGYLERPYSRRDDGGGFERFCDAEGIEYDDPSARDRYDDWVEAGIEDAAERRAEARADALEDRMNDRDVW